MNRAISYIIVFLVFISVLSCKKKIETEKAVTTVSGNENTYYFPVQTDSLDQKYGYYEEKKLHPELNEIFSEYLRKMNEPILYNKTDSGYTIRYMFLGEPFFNPEVYRLQISATNVSVTNKQLGMKKIGISDLIPGNAIKDTTFYRDLKWFKELDNKLNSYNIAFQPTRNEIGLDGVFFILEVYKNGNYDFVYRWSPTPENESEFIGICQMIEAVYKENK